MSENPFGFVWTGVRDALFGASLNNFAATYSLEEGGLRGRGFLHNSGASDGVVGWYVDEVEFYSCSDETPPSDCGNSVLDSGEQWLRRKMFELLLWTKVSGGSLNQILFLHHTFSLCQ